MTDTPSPYDPESGLWVLRDLGFTPVIAEELGHMCVAWVAAGMAAVLSVFAP